MTDPILALMLSVGPTLIGYWYGFRRGKRWPKFTESPPPELVMTAKGSGWWEKPAPWTATRVEHPAHDCQYSSGESFPEHCTICKVCILHRYCTICGGKNKILHMSFDGQDGSPMYQGVCPEHGVTS